MTSLTMVRAGPAPSARRSRQRVPALLAVPVALAVIVRAFLLLRPGVLFGVTEYDDGVYVSETLQWLNGIHPYRDVPMVHPPGILLVLAPVAALAHLIGTDGVLAAGRLLTAAVDVVNVIVVGRLLRHRGRGAQVAGMTVLALYPAGVLASQTVLLEPYLNLFCLLAAMAAFDGGHLASRRRLVGSGVLLGVAATVKIFAVLPAAVLLAYLLVRHRRDVAGFVAGAASAFVAVVLPFAGFAPAAFVRQAIIDQLSRTSSTRTPLLNRVNFLDGMVSGPDLGRLVGLAIGVLAVAGLVVLVRRARSIERLDDLDHYAGWSLVAVVASLLWAATMWYHYASFAGPFLAILVGSLLPRAVGRARRAEAIRVAAVATALASCGLLAFIGSSNGTPAPTALRSILPSGACVFSDQVSTVLAAGAWRQVDGCPLIVDSDGATLTWDGGIEPATVTKEAAVITDRRWEAIFDRADYLVLSRGVAGSIPMAGSLRSWIANHFRTVTVLPDGNGTVWVRNDSPFGVPS